LTEERNKQCDVERRRATTADLHTSWPEETARSCRTIGICRPTGPATLVFGSARGGLSTKAGVETVKRSTGGGAVLIAPGAQVWVDVWLPRDDLLWDDDIVRSSTWLGRAWCDALSELGVGDLEVHEGRLARTEMSDLICFAGLGPGEVTWKGRKLVGISQRRVKQGARFQTVSPWKPTGPALSEIIDTDLHDVREIEVELFERTTCLKDAFADGGRQDPGSLLMSSIEDSVSRQISRAGR
jgi:lipoate-protein ligase A